MHGCEFAIPGFWHAIAPLQSLPSHKPPIKPPTRKHNSDVYCLHI